MIPQIIFKKLALPWIEKIFFKMFDQQALIWKFRENNDYRELPNEADLKSDKAIKITEKLSVEHEMFKGELKDMMDDVNKLKNIASKVKKIRSL